MKNQNITGQAGCTFTGWADSLGFTGVIPTGGIGGHTPAEIIAEHVESLSCCGYCDGIIIVIDRVVIII